MSPGALNALITLGLGGMSLFGGDETANPRVPYNFTRDKRRLAGPEQSLYEALRSTLNLGAGLQERRPTRMRSAYVPGAPGVLGQELIPEDRGATKYQPFDRSLLEPAQRTRRRSPWHP